MTAETPFNDADALRVFISYSRSEVHFADELELFLSNSDFRPLVDRNAIDAGEAWKDRLGELILAADTVVFVLSDTSAASAICRWEAEEAERLSKRILVVTLGQVSASIELPQQLAGINWISCWANPAVPGSSQTRGFFDLSAALRTDLGWRRQQTALQEQARRWTDRAAIANSPLLLRQDLLDEALDWARRIPNGASVPRDVAAFLAASEAHEAQLRAEATAGLAEREAALKAAEQAASKQMRAERGLRIVSVLALCVGTILFAGATAAAWFAAEYFVRSREVQSAVIADAALKYAEDNDDLKALRVALMADPSAKASTVESLLRPDGYVDARAALERAWLSRTFASATRIPESEVGKSTSIQQSRLPEPVRALRYDGARLVTGYLDGRVEVLEIASGKIWRPAPLSDFAIRSAAFADASDRLITTASDGRLALWNLEGELQAQVTLGEPADAVAITSDATMAAMIDKSGRVHVWDIERGGLVAYSMPASGEPGHSYSNTCAVAVSPDQNWVVAARQNGSVIVWPAGSPELPRHLSSSTSGPEAVLIQYDNIARNQRALTELVLLRDEAFGAANDAFRAPLKICPLSISADSRLIAAATDWSVSIWKLVPAGVASAPGEDSGTGELAQRYLSLPERLQSIRLTNNEGALKIVYVDGRVDEVGRDADFGMRDGDYPGTNLLPAPRPPPVILAEAPVEGGHLFLTGPSPTVDLVVRRSEPVLELESEVLSGCRSIAQIEELPDSPEPTVLCTELVPDESPVSTGSGRSVNMASGETDANRHFLHEPGFLSGPGKILVDVWPEQDATTVAWDSPFGPVEFSFGAILVRTEGTAFLSYSPDRSRAVTVSVSGTTRFWQAGREKPLELEETSAGPSPEEHSFETLGLLGLPVAEEVAAVAFDQRGDTVWLGFSDGTLERRSFLTGAVTEARQLESCRIASILNAPTDDRVYVGCQSGEIQIWLSGATLPARSAHFGYGIVSLALSPDRRQLFAGQNNGSIAILSAANLWELGRSPDINEAWPGALTVSGDGRQIFAGYSNGVVRTWEIAGFLELSVREQIDEACALLRQARSPGLKAADFARFTSLRALPDPCTDLSGKTELQP